MLTGEQLVAKQPRFWHVRLKIFPKSALFLVNLPSWVTELCINMHLDKELANVNKV